MHYVPAYLRPVSQMNTGLDSRVDGRAEKVESITAPGSGFRFKQSDEFPVWIYEEALDGKTVIEHGREVRITEKVVHPERHWWIISDGVLENLDRALNEHADIFDLLLAINLCIDGSVAFSQSPGQTTSGAYRVRQHALDYRGDLRPGSFPQAILTMDEIPSVVSIEEPIDDIFRMVRFFRSISIRSDEHMDIRIALHMYDDALTSSLWTAMANFFFVCENVLSSGYPSDPVARISEETKMTKDEADNWKTAVNRLKHPDKGDVPSLYKQGDLKIPSLEYMRQTANTALLGEMRRTYADLEGEP